MSTRISEGNDPKHKIALGKSPVGEKSDFLLLQVKIFILFLRTDLIDDNVFS